jgi:hypothetical protein
VRGGRAARPRGTYSLRVSSFVACPRAGEVACTARLHAAAMALAAAAAAGRGFAYCVRGGLYLSLTNETNSVSLLESRGPGFSMSKSSGFALLDSGVEPTGALT